MVIILHHFPRETVLCRCTVKVVDNWDVFYVVLFGSSEHCRRRRLKDSSDHLDEPTEQDSLKKVIQLDVCRVPTQILKILLAIDIVLLIFRHLLSVGHITLPII